MKIYEVTLGQSAAILRDRWLVKAESLIAAVLRAEKKLKSEKKAFADWYLTGAREIGDLKE